MMDLLKSKKGLIATTLSAALFISTVAHAQSGNFEHTPSNNNVYMLFAPELTSEGTTAYAVKHVSQSSSELLLPSRIKASGINNTCKAKKKNDMYELSAIFNDKLHQLLSYFDDKPALEVAETVKAKDEINVDS